MTAPVDPRGLAEALRPHGASVMLPREAYVDSAVLACEKRHLFAGSWTCLGRAGELAEGTTHRSTVVGDVTVLLTSATGPARSPTPAGAVKATPRMGETFDPTP